MRSRSRGLNLLVTTFLLAGVVLGGLGCSNVRALAKVEAMDREIRRDRIAFYEKMSDGYYIMAYQWYTLATEAEDRREVQRAKDYATWACLYNFYYKDAKKRANELRTEFDKIYSNGVGKGALSDQADRTDAKTAQP